jgi:hypothetical protein
VKQQTSNVSHSGSKVSHSGCANAFVPISESSGFTRFKQLSTRRAPIKRELATRRTSSTSDLMGRRIQKSRTIREASSPTVTEPSVTVAVHQFRGWDKARAAVLQEPANLHSPASPGGKSPPAILSSSALARLPESSSQRSSYVSRSSVGSQGPPMLDFPTLKASDREKQPELQQKSHVYGVSEDSSRWGLVKDAVLGSEIVETRGHTSTPIITYSGTNGYSTSNTADVSQPTIIQPSQVHGQTRSHGMSEETNVDRHRDVSIQEQHGEHFYSGEQQSSPGQGRPWLMVEQTKDHPGRRKDSGFLQPIKHLSGKKVVKM